MGPGKTINISIFQYSLIKKAIEREFTLISSGDYEIRSPKNPRYNCFAWAASEVHQPWSPNFPDTYWPESAPDEETLDAFIEAFRTKGYEPCDNDSFEEGFEKVAIYVDNETPKHMARQYESGIWSSKLGTGVDIEHATLRALEGNLYGHIAQILKRPVREGSYKKAEYIFRLIY